MTPQEYLDSYRLYLRGDVNGDMLSEFDRQQDEYLKAVPSLNVPLTIVITSGGGASIVGRALHERIQILATRVEVNALALGDCSSAALLFFVAVDKPHRYTTTQSHFLLHEMSRGNSDVKGGTTRERDLGLEYALKDQAWLHTDQAWGTGLLAKACGLNVQEMKIIIEEHKHLTGASAVRMGLAGSLLRLQKHR